MWKPNFKLATDSAAAAWHNGGLKFFELSNHLGNVMSVITWLITPHGSMTATSALWGVLTNEDMPGGVDDLTRLARKSVADIFERSSSKFNGIGSVGDGIDNLLRGNKSLRKAFMMDCIEL